MTLHYRVFVGKYLDSKQHCVLWINAYDGDEQYRPDRSIYLSLYEHHQHGIRLQTWAMDQAHIRQDIPEPQNKFEFIWELPVADTNNNKQGLDANSMLNAWHEEELYQSASLRCCWCSLFSCVPSYKIIPPYQYNCTSPIFWLLTVGGVKDNDFRILDRRANLFDMIRAYLKSLKVENYVRHQTEIPDTPLLQKPQGVVYADILPLAGREWVQEELDDSGSDLDEQPTPTSTSSLTEIGRVDSGTDSDNDSSSPSFTKVCDKLQALGQSKPRRQFMHSTASGNPPSAASDKPKAKPKPKAKTLVQQMPATVPYSKITTDEPGTFAAMYQTRG